MKRLKFFRQSAIETTSQFFLKGLSFSQGYLKRMRVLVLAQRIVRIFYDVTLVLSLCLFPVFSILFKDFIYDQKVIKDTEVVLQKSLETYTEKHMRLFLDLREKILLESLLDNPMRLQQLFRDLAQLKDYVSGAYVYKVMGARWVTPELRAIGMYGKVQNFDHKLFLPFLRSLEQMPNVVHIAEIGDQTYAGLGIKEHDEIRGYLFFPTSLEECVPHPSKLRLYQISYEASFPGQGVPFDELLKNPSSFLKPYKIINWDAYLAENLTAYVLFFLCALAYLFLKKKDDAKKEDKLSQSVAKANALADTLAAQQNGINLLLNRFHDTNESIMEVSHLLLETKSASNVLTEKEQTKLVKKIYEAACLCENQLISGKQPAVFEVCGLIDQCLRFYASNIREESILLQKDYLLSEVVIEADKGAFCQLLLNLFYKALERTPEEGSILVKMTAPPEEKNSLFILTLEDSGYPFSAEELKNFKKQGKSLFESYFDLEWEKIFELAKILNCQISFEKVFPMGNRMTIVFYNHMLSQEEIPCGDNIVKLFPSG